MTADEPALFFHLPPDGPATARLSEAEQFFLAGNLNEALAAAQQAWREHPECADVFRVLAYVHMARGEYEPAANAGYRAVQLDDNNPASFASYAQVFISFNVLAKAEDTLRHALTRFPGEPSLQTLAADVAFRYRRDAQGEALAQAALARNPDDVYAKALLGSYYVRARQYWRALPLMVEVTAKYPHRVDYQRDGGLAALHVGQYREAVRLLAAAWRLQHTDPATQRALFLALRMAVAPNDGYWRLTLYFHDRVAGGWLMIIGGFIAAVVGMILLSIGNAAPESQSAIFPWAAGFLIVAFLLILLPMPGMVMRGRKGRKLDVEIDRLLKQQGVGQPSSAVSGQ